MPPVPTSYTNPTGKQALLSSLNDWLVLNVPTSGASDFTYGFLISENPAVMPRVDVNEFKYFDPSETAMGGMIFPAATGAQQSRGKENRTLIEFWISTDQKQSANAKEKMYQIRDRLVYGLNAAGVDDGAGNVLVPPIAILDPANSSFDTGTVARLMSEEDNYLIENYFPPSAAMPTIHRYQLLAKISWYEMRS